MQLVLLGSARPMNESARLAWRARASEFDRLRIAVGHIRVLRRTSIARVSGATESPWPSFLLPSSIPSFSAYSLPPPPPRCPIKSTRLGCGDGGGLCFLSLILDHRSHTHCGGRAERILYSGRAPGGRCCSGVGGGEGLSIYSSLPASFLPSPQPSHSNLLLSSPLLTLKGKRQRTTERAKKRVLLASREEGGGRAAAACESEGERETPRCADKAPDSGGDGAEESECSQ